MVGQNPEWDSWWNTYDNSDGRFEADLIGGEPARVRFGAVHFEEPVQPPRPEGFEAAFKEGDGDSL